MWLPSRLERSTLGDILGSLHRAAATGSLEVFEVDGSAAGARRAIHLRRGRVVGVEAAGARIGDLIASGQTPRWEVESALAGEHVGGGPIAGERLLQRGLADAARLHAALLAQAVERLEGLYRLRRGEIRFRAAGRRVAVGVPLELGPDAFLHGRPRRVPRAAPQRDDASPSAAATALGRLGLPEGASAEELRRAFRRRAAVLHPDRARNPTARQVLERALSDLTATYHAALTTLG